MEYIDVEKLKAEIERYIKHYEKLDRDEFKNGELYICQELLSFINSLEHEQSDEDLDTDIEMEWDSFRKHLREYDDDTEEVVWLDWYDFKDVAYYFYDLGLNARKEKQPKSVDLKHLIDWYIASVNEKEQPVWTEEHLKELLKDFILIPK